MLVPHNATELLGEYHRAYNFYLSQLRQSGMPRRDGPECQPCCPQSSISSPNRPSDPPLHHGNQSLPHGRHACSTLLEWQTKSPALGQPSVPMAKKSTPKWQTKSPAFRQPSARMAQKSTPKWQMKSPALGQPSAPMAKKSTPEWQTKSPASGQPSAPRAQKSTPEWQTKSPASGQPSSALMTKNPTPEWQLTSPTLGKPSACISGRECPARPPHGTQHWSNQHQPR